jgi:DNA ligase-1
MSELQGMRATMNIVDEYMGNEARLQILYSIFKELQNTSSTIAKQNLLKQHENDELFKEILKFLLDNQIVTGISKKKIDKKIKPTNLNIGLLEITAKPFIDIFNDLLNYVKEHNTGTDIDIAYVQFYINFLAENEELRQFVKSIITKSLKLGVDVKTVNKVYGKDFIPMLNVMLGTSIEKCKIPEGTWFAISQKLNGSRCFYYKGKLYTRQGKIYTGCEHIIKNIERLDSDYDVTEKWEWVYDGELVLKNTSLSDSEAFQKGVGIANSDKENKEELKLVIFDTIPTEQFEKGQSRSPYQARKILLENYSQRIKALGLSNIEVVPMFYEGTDQAEIWKWLDYAEENDMEGIMINLDTPYECKRTKNLIKVKKFYTLDLKVMDAVEGDGRLKGTLGALVVDYKGNTVNVGSGFSDEQRKEFWENKDSIIGRVIEVKYKEITKNKDTGLESLQFPVFVSLREQGKEVSYD